MALGASALENPPTRGTTAVSFLTGKRPKLETRNSRLAAVFDFRFAVGEL
jgi:hypothetical protein